MCENAVIVLGRKLVGMNSRAEKCNKHARILAAPQVPSLKNGGNFVVQVKKLRTK